MGLDMYLEKEFFIGANYEHQHITGAVDISENGVHVPIRFNRISKIVEQIGYWRKANAIHQWFVDNVQDGEDDCKRYYVAKEQLEILLDNVQRILKNKSRKLALELLPPSSGSFFGSLEIDEGYWYDLKETKKILTFLLDELAKDYDQKIYPTIYYQSSW